MKEKQEKKVIFVGHRGSKIYGGVENTIESFRGGQKAKCDALECDIRVTADDVIIICHDNTLTRLTQESATPSDLDVNKSKYEDIKNIQLSQINRGVLSKGYICLFEDYLKLCQKYQLIPIIEIKWTNGMYSSNDDPLNYNYSKIEMMIDLVKKHNLYDTACIITSMIGCLKYLRLNHPHLSLQQLTTQAIEESLDELEKYHIDIDMQYEACTKDFVDKCHKRNIKVNIWTLNDPDLLPKYLDMGVDMITSDWLAPCNINSK